MSVIASCVVVALVLLVVLAQALLPSLAARRVRDRVARYGTVRNVSVSAFPAIELLWGKAGTVNITAGRLSVPAGRIASLLWESHDVTNVTVTADAATLTAVPSLSQGLTVHELRVQKRGARGQRERHLDSAAARRSAPQRPSDRTDRKRQR